VGIRHRGKPKLSVFQLLMALTAHALAPSGNLAVHANGVSKKKISVAAFSKRRRRLPWQNTASAFLPASRAPTGHRLAKALA